MTHVLVALALIAAYIASADPGRRALPPLPRLGRQGDGAAGRARAAAAPASGSGSAPP